ncbi:(d)CMP kinase [Nocardioides sp. Kera G14]|uniref:(d)CMP kinase n=1 Tax=Nocardioides sp. Kera G14 TaxID=2884264 RepID=UPI001D10CF2B|nr:(d)CMP kinase [Nocardioides sp. Kera G14]UDY25258.1 (d)CMP kinase [Nocardioides sp. Kera G14]
MSTPLVVAVDGTSGSGKSSTSRGVADRLGLRYLDTGAQFRAMTWWMLSNDVDVHDADAVAAAADKPVIMSGTDPNGPTITLDGTDVSREIRTDEVNGSVSPVSAVPAVRARLLELQRGIIREALTGPGIVVEGRDIGSVVWPEADLKLYVSADPSARATRRAAEVGSSDDASIAATKASLEARDVIDSGRTTAPLVQADGAVHLDTTHITLEQAIDQVVQLAVELTSQA